MNIICDIFRDIFRPLLTVVLAIFIPVLTAVIGYFLGSVKFFREHQLKMYGDALPHIMKFSFDRQAGVDEKSFNAALQIMLLYASRNVVLKLDDAISIIIDPSRGNFITAMQKAIVEMRRDIQPWWRARKRMLRQDEIKHFYVKVMDFQSDA
jgi:hypothetical protein